MGYDISVENHGTIHLVIKEGLTIETLTLPQEGDRKTHPTRGGRQHRAHPRRPYPRHRGRLPRANHGEEANQSPRVPG